ncbi:MAG TPA: endolytic transglycosylase MltG [Bryobacteraceae bacterium]|jgi:UPF0755 protein
MKRILAVAAGIIVIAALAVPKLVLDRRYKGFSEPVDVEIAKGEGARGIADQLAKAGVVQSSYFLLGARLMRPNAKLQAGSYRFEKAASPLEVFDRIAKGDVVHYEVTIPEGSNIFDIASIAGRIPFLKSEKVLAILKDPAPIRDLDPAAPSLEGYLFPSTYRLTRRTTEEQLVHMMLAEFRKVWKQTAPVKANVHDVVTLASMVEKESAARDERPIVAAVYANRLIKGMRLECDPTTIYAAMLEGRYRGKIHRSDLDSDNPYNTYRHVGMPPGPIANPGEASIAAALKPAMDSKYLFFVAKPDGSGRHNFAVTLTEHNHNVAEYRRGIAQSK